MLFTGITRDQFKDLPHTRWSVRGNIEVKTDGLIVAVSYRGVCSAKWCKTTREAKRTFLTLLYR